MSPKKRMALAEAATAKGIRAGHIYSRTLLRGLANEGYLRQLYGDTFEITPKALAWLVSQGHATPRHTSGRTGRSPMRKKTNKGLREFVHAYITAALWSSTDDEGEPLDANYGPDDIAPATRKKMFLDAISFYKKHVSDIETANIRQTRRSGSEFGNAGMAGHDFWLTREGHGAGFWDGDWSEPQATRLDNASKTYGGFDLYIGDDGMIHGDTYHRGRPSMKRASK